MLQPWARPPSPRAMDDANRKPLPFAHAADIIRAHQKDEYCRGMLRQHFCESLEELVGYRRAVPWQGTAALLADCAYALITAVLSRRTLGEEYCEIVAVSPSLRRPSQFRRSAAAALLLLVGPALRRLLLASSPGARGQLGFWRRALRSAAGTLPLVLRLHLAVFYITSAYRHVADRFAGLRFVSVADRPYRNFSYWYLGVLLAAQAAGEVVSWYLQWRREGADTAAEEAAAAAVRAASAKHPSRVPMPAAAPDERAPLCNVCMCPAECTTSTPCGHLFCWECIASWCAIKATCPLCRSAALPQQLLALRHYESPRAP